MTARWLLGAVRKHPSYPALPDPETRRIIKPLVRLNRSGFITDFSQPAEPLQAGSAQRAAVSGFCPEPVALRLAAVTLLADLLVLVYPPNQGGGYQIPITLEDYRPFTWCGSFDPGEHIGELRGLSRKAREALRRSWYAVAIDPKWGRKGHLWRHLLRAIQKGTLPYDIAPAPGLGLDTDFVF